MGHPRKHKPGSFYVINVSGIIQDQTHKINEAFHCMKCMSTIGITVWFDGSIPYYVAVFNSQRKGKKTKVYPSISAEFHNCLRRRDRIKPIYRYKSNVW